MDSRAQETWNQVISGLNEVKKMTEATDIESSRSYFEKVSESMIDVFTSYKMEQDTLYVQHCPMVGRDLGANWLSRSKEVLNPYFGSQMLHCGEVVKEIY
jgi:Cu(I)/Ag(I) efflux system membrane fusion protein